MKTIIRTLYLVGFHPVSEFTYELRESDTLRIEVEILGSVLRITYFDYARNFEGYEITGLKGLFHCLLKLVNQSKAYELQA